MIPRLASAVLASAACAFAAHADITSGLVAHWPFDGNFNDVSGFGRHAIVNGAPGFVPGSIGSAASFDGVDDWLRVNHGGALTFDLDTQSYTVAVWFYSEALPNNSDPCIIQDRYGSNHAVSYNLLFNADTTPKQFACGAWYGEGTGTGVGVRVPASGLVESWHHAALTCSHTLRVMTLYIDGVERSSAALPAENFHKGNGNTVTIGGYYSSNNIVENFFRGRIDDLRIYNRALSQADIRELICPADFNASGSLGVQDIFDYLAAYFAGEFRADFNKSQSLTIQDLFDFLTAYFTGCP